MSLVLQANFSQMISNFVKEINCRNKKYKFGVFLDHTVQVISL